MATVKTEGNVAIVPLNRYEAMEKIFKMERNLTKMFDSDNRVAMALLHEIRVFNVQKVIEDNQLKLNLDENRCKCEKACKHKGG